MAFLVVLFFTCMLTNYLKWTRLLFYFSVLKKYLHNLELKMYNHKIGKDEKLPNSALSRGDIFFGGCRGIGGGEGEHGGVGRLDALVISRDCNQDRLVNSASTP